MDYNGFREFLKSEIKQRNVSVREFAVRVDVSHTTILRFIEDNPNKPNVPTVELLEKLSQATGISLNTLLAICFPDTARQLEIDPEVGLITDSISKLPSGSRQMVLKFVRSLLE